MIAIFVLFLLMIASCQTVKPRRHHHFHHQQPVATPTPIPFETPAPDALRKRAKELNG